MFPAPAPVLNWRYQRLLDSFLGSGVLYFVTYNDCSSLLKPVPLPLGHQSILLFETSSLFLLPFHLTPSSPQLCNTRSRCYTRRQHAFENQSTVFFPFCYIFSIQDLWKGACCLNWSAIINRDVFSTFPSPFMGTEVEWLFSSWAVSFPEVALKPVNTHTVLLTRLGCEHLRLEAKQVSFGALLCSVLQTFLPKISLWSGYLPHLSFISVALPGFDTIFASDHFTPTCAASFESLGDLFCSRSLLQSERPFCSLGNQSKHLSLAFPKFIPKQHLGYPYLPMGS